MKKTVNQKIRKIRRGCKPLFLGVLLSGALLLPSTGLFPSSSLGNLLFAENNQNVEIINSNRTINNNSYNTGLINNGNSTVDSGTYQITSGATLVLGKLDTTTNSIVVTDESTLTFSADSSDSSYGSLLIGDDSSSGIFTVAGTVTEQSLLTINEDAVIEIYADSVLNVGYVNGTTQYQGAVDINLDTFELDNGGTIIKVAASGTLDANDISISSSGNSIEVNGTMTASDITIDESTGSNTSITVNNGGKLNAANLSDSNYGSGSSSGGTLDNEGTISLSGKLTWNSTFENSGSITAGNDSSILSYNDAVGASLSVEGDLEMEAEDYDVKGTLDVDDLTALGEFGAASSSVITADSIVLNNKTNYTEKGAQFNGKVTTGSISNTGTILFGYDTGTAANNIVDESDEKSNPVVSVTGLISSGELGSNYEGGISIWKNSDSEVTTPEVTAGGLAVFADFESSPAVEGGTLSLETGTELKITGLTNKFNDEGTQGTGDSYLYDIYLDGAMKTASTSVIDLSSGDTDNPMTSGIRLGYNQEVSTTSTANAPSGSNVAGSITADTLYLSGVGLTDGTNTYSLLSMSGLLQVNNELILSNREADANDNMMIVALTGTANSIEKLTYATDNIQVTNGNGSAAAVMTIGKFDMTSGKFTTEAAATTTITDLTLSGNAVMGTGQSTYNTTSKANVNATLTATNTTIQDGAALTIAAGTTANLSSLSMEDGSSMTIANGVYDTTNSKNFNPFVKIGTAEIEGGIINLGAGAYIQGDGAVEDGNSLVLSNDAKIIATTDSTYSSQFSTAYIQGAGEEKLLDLSIDSTSAITNTNTTAGTNTTLSFMYVDIQNDGSLGSGGNVLLTKSNYRGSGTIYTNVLQFSDSSTDIAEVETVKVSGTAPKIEIQNTQLGIGFAATNDLAVFEYDTVNGTQGTVELASDSSFKAIDIEELEIGTYTRYLVKSSNGITDAGTTCVSTAFQSLSSSIDEDNGSMLMTLNVDARTFEEMGTIYGQTNNLTNIGKYIDSFENTEQQTEEVSEMINGLREMKEKDDLLQAMNVLTGVQKANSLVMAMDSPWMTPFDQLGYATHRDASVYGNDDSMTVLGQEPVYDDGYVTYPNRPIARMASVFGIGTETQSHSIWAVAQHTAFTGDTDGNSDDYYISNSGTTIGYDWINTDGAVAGLAFRAAFPYLKADNQRIRMDNFHLGIYAGKKSYTGVGAKFYIGYGIQQYTNKRGVIYNGFSEAYNTAFGGSNLAACFQLSKEWNMNPCYIIRPLVQIDTQCVWQDSVAEEGGASALHYDKASWNQTYFRTGIENEFNTQFYRFTSRAIYGLMLSGDSAPESTASFVGVANDAAMTIQGVDIGESFGIFGVGALGYLDCSKQWSISGNYDFSLTENTHAHTGSVNLSYFF